MDGGDFIYWIVIAIWVLSKIIGAANKNEDEEVAAPAEPLPDLEEILAEMNSANPSASAGTSAGTDMDGGALLALPGEGTSSQSSAINDVYDEFRQDLITQLDGFIQQLEVSIRSARVTRETTHIAEVMESYAQARAQNLRTRVRQGSGPIASDIQPALEHLYVIQDACETFIRQRRMPQLKRALGDADELARACYEPIATFAQVNRLQLSSAYPVTMLTPMDLGLWASFVPTGLAPISLPPDFFADIRWWPAIAHEIGHDFFAATENAQARMRAELGVSSEMIGRRLITAASVNYIQDELIRIFGAWFEEIFCDVFATMMMGPAYGYSMVSLFADPDFPQQVVTVRVNPARTGYAEHPPRHLRVLWCAHLLELKGEEEAASEIRAEWQGLHGDQPQLIYPTHVGNVGIPTEAIAAIGYGLIKSLYSKQFEALDGHSLRDIPGLEYSNHRAAESRRSRDEMLSGRAPSSHPTRAVIAGAVLAWHQAPDRQAEFMSLARRAVVGVTEHREDVYESVGAEMDGRGVNLREAFLLHTLLSPPPSVRAYRRASATNGFLARRQWPPR